MQLKAISCVFYILLNESKYDTRAASYFASPSDTTGISRRTLESLQVLQEAAVVLYKSFKYSAASPSYLNADNP